MPYRITGLCGQRFLAFALASFFFAVPSAHAAGGGKMTRLESARTGAMIPLYVHPAEGASATVVLMTGGKGGIGALNSEGWPGGQNFVLRAAPLFLSMGFNVVIMAKPSDRAELDGPFRVSKEHVDDIRIALKQVAQHFKVPVWIVGTSWGATSTAMAAIALRDERLIDGIVLTSSVTSYKIPQAVTRMDLEIINVPTLVVHHDRDECRHCQPFEVSHIIKGLKSAPIKKQVMVSGGSNPTGDPCEALHYHGYIGMEKEAVAMITDWIKKPSN